MDQETIDLADALVVDNHCHGFRPASLLQLERSSWEQRLTMMGMCYMTSGSTDEELSRKVASLNSSTVFALAARRWLSAYLGVRPGEDLSYARHEAFRASPAQYVAGLLADQRVVALLADEGYPQPTVSRREFEKAAGVPVFRVARIEPSIVTLREKSREFKSFESRYEAWLEEAGQDVRCVAYKSIIAYRSGLDITHPKPSEAREAYRRWRDKGWVEDRSDSKVVRDYLVHSTLRAAKRFGKPLHVHCGGGDPDVRLTHARPQDLFTLLAEYPTQPVVLIHAGYPWIAEAAYVASVLPYVYLDLSEFLPWASLGVDRDIETLLGAVPGAKLLYGSDEASEPEVLWISAKIARAALERVLSSAVERDYLTATEATRIGRGILGENSLELHGISL
jgi:predicted TIM-barrel fold metal-dependent hydrolase